jgi:hypothetical protein
METDPEGEYYAMHEAANQLLSQWCVCFSVKGVKNRCISLTSYSANTCHETISNCSKYMWYKRSEN